MYNDIAFKDLIKDIMLSANLTENDYEIQDNLKNIAISGYIPICSNRQALQQAVFAVGAVADCSRSDKIKIYVVDDDIGESNNTIEKSNYEQGSQKIEQNELITRS